MELQTTLIHQLTQESSYRLEIGADPKLPSSYRIPRTTRVIFFANYGDELNHDDVISTLDKAEDDLKSELKIRDDYIGKILGWNFLSAHLVIRNDKGSDGVDHRQLLSFLNGLRLFGQQYGFWICDMELFDIRSAIPEKGRGRLEVAASPRAEAVAEAS
ncbi:MAG: hypothetical protein Q9169_001060 [Polycauliona sp. 2 TL-2023]